MLIGLLGIPVFVAETELLAPHPFCCISVDRFTPIFNRQPFGESDFESKQIFKIMLTKVQVVLKSEQGKLDRFISSVRFLETDKNGGTGLSENTT